jgi:molecular chaperone GrpE
MSDDGDPAAGQPPAEDTDEATAGEQPAAERATETVDGAADVGADDGAGGTDRTQGEEGTAGRTADGAGQEAADGAADDGSEGDGVEDADAGEDLGLAVDRSVVERAAEYDEALAEDVERLYEEAGDLSGRLVDLESELDEREAEVEDLRSRLKRKQADFENYKKRRKREEEKIRDRATEDLVERLLDVRDNLRRAAEEDHDDVEGLREGVQMTLTEFDRVLDAEDVAAIEPAPGEAVDPQRHEVMMRVDSDRPEGDIADVYEPGYEMAGKVLRPAKVAVSDGDD